MMVRQQHCKVNARQRPYIRVKQVSPQCKAHAQAQGPARFRAYHLKQNRMQHKGGKECRKLQDQADQSSKQSELRV